MAILDQGIGYYREQLIELERVSALLGPGKVLGDFNAHFGRMCGGRGVEDPNLQAVLLWEYSTCNVAKYCYSGSSQGGQNSTIVSSRLN